MAVRILYVDDEPGFRNLVKDFLEMTGGFTVDVADSAENALTLLSHTSYDVIISDYHMHGMTGVDFLRQIRSFDSSIPFIIFTGQGDEDVVIEALNAGADFYLKKGSESGPQFLELTQVINILVSRSQSISRLKESEEKFRTIAEYTHEWMYWLGPTGDVIYISPSCEDITGYTREEFSLDPALINTIVFRDDRAEWDTHQQIDIQTYRLLSLDFRIVHKNGEVRWISHVCQAVYNSDGNFAGRRTSNRDVTRRKEAESRAILERDNFLKIFRAAPIGLLLLDHDLKIDQINDVISTIVLHEPAEIIGNRVGNGLSCQHSLDHPNGCGYGTACPECPLRNAIDTVLKEGTSVHGAILPLTLLFGGSPHLRWLSVNAEPLEIEGSTHVIVAIDDITEKREMEIALRESEAKFRTLSVSIPAGILTYQRNYWTYANPAAEEISGYTQAELLSMHFWDLIHPDYQESLKELGLARQAGMASGSRQFELIVINKNGEERWVELNASSVTIRGEVAGLITVFDVTERKNIERQLVLSEEKYRSIFENQIDLLYQTDINGVIQTLSPSCLKLAGYTPTELVGHSVLDLYADPVQKKILNEKLIKDGIVYDFETVLIDRKGTHVPVSINSHIIYDNAGLPVRIEGTIRDITERKNTENALRRSEEHYRSLFENMLEGFAYCRMMYDESGSPTNWLYLQVNQAYERIFGVSTIQGRTVTELIPGIRDANPELFEIYNNVVLSGLPKTCEVYLPLLDSWHSISAYRPEEGHFVIIFEDITQRKRSEQMLHKLIAEQRTILENVPAMIWYKDTKNNFVKVNPAAAHAFGMQVEEIEGKNYVELFPTTPDRYYADDLEVINSGIAKLGIIEPLHIAHGAHIWVQTDKVPLRDQDGTIIGVLVVSGDITERKKAKDAITLAHKKLNLLSNITRHDVVNQLQGMFVTLDIARTDPLGPDTLIMIEKADVFAHNIERQIAFTRDYQDIGLASPVWADLYETINEAVTAFREISVRIFIDNDSVKIYADPLLVKVFHNLIDNALRYGEKISEIRFSGSAGPAGYTIICEDDGVGIPDQFKQKIFNREYFKHTGFGLNLSRDILEITGITIIENGEAGKGARFEIQVPPDGYRISQDSEKLLS
ncbi:PAS domain S-box protein [uncultured Methanospirillum sp.]|uniref:hybrid sensor histidine kinase/response regulator n=1 Tax=uncultured Methanospirillum sp. TaxID=262503 RepID=UPI0029C607DC|nr:PAS domain S-box protein [uncultured Methanospirillum sp.]